MPSICIIVGARPNFVKVAPLVRAIAASPCATYSLVYSGRADDPTLEASLFADLDMPRPDTFLGCDSVRLNEITSSVMRSFDHFLDNHPADVVVVVDDLASTMAAAIVAKKRGLRLAHLVAGTRSFDAREPKEVNRLVIDALSDYLFTAGMRTNSVATREQQTDDAHTYMVGNILIDSLRHSLPAIDKLTNPLPTLCPDIPADTTANHILLTLNRRAILNDTSALHDILTTITTKHLDTPIIAPLRPTAADIVRNTLQHIPSTFHLVPPQPYLTFEWLLSHARAVITDSGNVAEEATFLGIPCITLADHAEHNETVTIGTNVLVGTDTARLSKALDILIAGQWKTGAIPRQWDGRTAERIVSILTEE